MHTQGARVNILLMNLASVVAITQVSSGQIQQMKMSFEIKDNR